MAQLTNICILLLLGQRIYWTNQENQYPKTFSIKEHLCPKLQKKSKPLQNHFYGWNYSLKNISDY